ncbi:alpha/beta-hydrolase [Clavulina sp. PMI_390]|nr:alpha/beta-hydrolase [Clavulina sp. PMI_390]
MSEALLQPNGIGTLKRINIPRRGSWHTTFFWSFLYLRRFFLSSSNSFSSVLGSLDPRHLVGRAPPITPPWTDFPAGPQVWDFPPNAKDANRVLEKGQDRAFGQWKNEESGWVMTTVSPPAGSPAPQRTILYFHGSGFQSPINGFHWGFSSYLSLRLDAEVVVVPYPLGPNNPGPQWRPALLSVYREFVDRAGDKEIILAGDSAGGTIVLGLIYDLHATNLPLPHQLVAISPPTDLASSNRPAMLEIEPYDPMLTVAYIDLALRIYAGVPVPSSIARAERTYTIPMPSEIASQAAYSPLAGNPAILHDAGTKVIVVNGEWDVLYPDVEACVAKLAEAEVDVTYIVGEKQIHVFPVLVGIMGECTTAAEVLVMAILKNGEDFHRK